MRKKGNKLTLGGSVGIVAMFLMSLAWPQTQLFAKIGALAIFAFICIVPLYKQKKEGYNVNANIGFTAALLVILAYVFFF